ncbi:unnamed protein product [Danaus chrysippus]|uniref:(African queen) hypothetical protein n=1 Tax=Danaus chrysippus TaxID=151541 RepID=A0A8J2RBS0_9NEOP|nr:unnamed protein product [Danaus chrysippus]
MEKAENFIDYYEVLQSEKSASHEELKKSYQRLVLAFHPDKSGNAEDEKFHLIQKAWSVLRDPISRKQYDAELSCYENTDLLLYDTISLSDMDFNATEELYSYQCRCSGIYYLDASELSESSFEVIISCNECSFCVKVNKK